MKGGREMSWMLQVLMSNREAKGGEGEREEEGNI